MKLALLLAAALGVWAGLASAGAGASAQDRAPVATDEQLLVLDGILARSEFSVEGRDTLDGALDPLREAVAAVVRELVRWVGRLPGGGPAAATTILVVATAIALGASLVVARLARGSMAADAALAEAAAAGPPRAEDERARALALERAGDLRGAVHHRYLAVLHHLDERGLLRFDRALTNREHLRRAAGPAVAETLGPLVAAFDRLWYGQASCSREEYERFVALADRAWEGARGET